MTENLANEYSATLVSSISNSATSFDVTPAPPAALAGGNFRMRLGDATDTPEYILVGSVSGGTLSGVTRGVEGSSAAAWAAGKGANHVLTAAGLLAAIPAGGAAADLSGTYFRHPLDRASLHATYGDEFDGASLNGRWTRHVQGSGEEAYQQGPRASTLRVTYDTAAAARYIYQTAPGGTNETWETSLTIWDVTSTGQMYGPLMVDSSGNGVGAFMYPNGYGLHLAVIASHAYSSTLSTRSIPTISYNSERHWLRLRKASGVFYGSYSLDGEIYSPELSGTPPAFTPARIGIGRFLGTDASDVVDWHWFDKTA